MSSSSSSLHSRARAFVEAFSRHEGASEMPESFDALACDIARHQAEHAPGFARLCQARGIDPAKLTNADDIPAVPTDAFKLTRVATFPPEEAKIEFHTSGTSAGAEARGRHAMREDGVTTYDAGALAFGRKHLFRDLESAPVVILSPSPAAMPHSSLVHMCAHFANALDAHPAWIIEDDNVIDISSFDMRVAEALAKREPMLILATSFALVHFLEAIGDASFALPSGSRVMQTGGFKGKSREVSADALRAELARVFAIPPHAIVSEYGMTELSSQFYERTLFDDPKHNEYAEPPWARVVPVDPESLARVTDSEIGIAKIIDLLNVDSAVAVLTQDRVRRCDNNGFELHGRATGAPSRGCSIAIDELLGRSVN